jgi:hypothetical protein
VYNELEMAARGARGLTVTTDPDMGTVAKVS